MLKTSRRKIPHMPAMFRPPNLLQDAILELEGLSHVS